MRYLFAILLAFSVIAAPQQDAQAAKEKEKGFVPLFDGKTLDGWQGATKDYVAEDGMLICKKGGNLYTDKEYGDFHFKFEFKIKAGANNGVGIRTPLKGDAAYAGMEIQILDDTASVYKNLKPYQYHGSIYGVVAAKKGHQKPLGEWNKQEIICKGSRVKVILNGTTIVDADIIKASTPKALDGNNHPGLKRKKGYIAFCGHGARVEFRNLRIKELKK